MDDPEDTWTSDALERDDRQAVRDRVLSDPDYLARRSTYGETPLRTAIVYDERALVEFMLAHGADPNATEDDGYTCLLQAVESEARDSTSILAALIAAGADVRTPGIHGWTPLHMAAARGHVEKARLLIAAGADINQRTEIDGGNTPLMEAASMGQPETVRLLLDHGADTALLNWISDQSAREMAAYSAAGPDLKVYEFIKNQPAPAIDLDTLLGGKELDPEVMALIKAQYASYDPAESYLQNTRQLAARGGHAEVIRLLDEHVRKGE